MCVKDSRGADTDEVLLDRRDWVETIFSIENIDENNMWSSYFRNNKVQEPQP